MENNNYYKKYLKYKKKYLELKDKIGGSIDDEHQKIYDLVYKNKLTSENNYNDILLVIYIKSFKNIFGVEYCEAGDDKKVEFFTKYISDSKIPEINILKEKDSEWDRLNFANINSLINFRIQEFCEAYKKKSNPKLVDGEGIYGSFDSKSIQDNIEKSIVKEEIHDEVSDIYR